MAASVTLSGFKEFQTKLKNLPKELRQEVGGETWEAAKHWEQLARQAAPKDEGRLVGSIKGNKTGEMESEVTANAEHAACQEWGTLTKVNVPSELQSYASEFRGGGKGSGKAKEFIYAWMNRVGVPEERQWFVFISIITKGIRPHPFFFIQKPFVEKEFVKNIQNILNTEH